MIQCFSDLTDPGYSDPSDSDVRLTPGGAVDAETACGEFPVSFHSHRELSRLHSQSLAPAEDEPVSIGRGWLLRMVRQRHAGTADMLGRAAS